MKRKIAIYTLALSCLLLTGCRGSNSDNNTGISTEDAKTIALKHAGLTKDDVTFTKTELDRDNGQIHYDVEFYTRDGMEYDYEIDGTKGNILEWDTEQEKR